MAVFPYASPNKIIRHHVQFKSFLEKHTGLKISLVTARNFQEFVRRTKKKKYDLIFTAPHHGRYAELNDAYQRIAMTSHNIQGVVLVAQNSPYKKIEDLKGKVVTTTPPITILTQLVLAHFKHHGLDQSNLEIIHTSTHSNAIYTVLNEHSDAAVTGITLWQKLPLQEKYQLRVLDSTIKVPGFMFMANETLSQEKLSQLKSLALRFKQDAFGQNYVFKGFQPISDADMNAVDPFLKVFDPI